MKLLIFILIYPLVWLISILPLRVLYFFSDILFFISYNIIGYRKDVVFNNLKLAFPEKSDKELYELTKKTLSHFLDFIFETIKTFTISKKELDKRFVFENIDLLKGFEKENRSIALMACHYGNWEWMSHMNNFSSFYPVAIYSEISNKYFNSTIKKSRARLGAELVDKHKAIAVITKYQTEKRRVGYGLLSDQSPQLHKTHYWGTFFGQHIPVITGAEFLSKKYDFIVLNLLTTRLKRGYYSVKFEVLTTEPHKYKDYEITDMYLKSIEEHITKAPEFYLWTHRRFKLLGRYDEWLEIQKKFKKAKFKEIVIQSLEALDSKKTILYPTDTVWGIGCDATSNIAVDKIYNLKKREETKALIILVSSIDMLKGYVEIPKKALEILLKTKRPTTIIYENPKGLAENLLNKENNSVAIRIVQDDFCRELIEKFGKPIVSTSANISDSPTPKIFSEIDGVILKGVDYVVDLRTTEVRIKSSRILKFVDDEIIVHRD